MKNHLFAITGFAVLTISTAARADLPVVEAPAKVAGRAAVIDLDGKRREFSFGNPSGQDLRERVGKGGAHLELQIAPNREALDRLKTDLEKTFETHGVGGELAGKVFDALKGLDRLGAVQVRGVAIGPDEEKQEFELEFGTGDEGEPSQFNKKMEQGGAQLELGVETTERTNDLLGLLMHAPESFQLLEKGLRNPETIKLLNVIVSNPEMMKFFESAADDPKLLDALRRGLEDPFIAGLLTKGLNNEGAANLLKLFGGAPKPAPNPAEPAPSDKAAEPVPPRETPNGDAEIDALQRELAEQRALLEAILKKLD